MASAREQKFLIKLQAEYAGEKAIDALKSDLKSIDKIDVFRRQQKKLVELRDEFATTSSDIKNLRAALEKSFDLALEKKIGKAAAQIESTSTKLAEATLSRSILKSAGWQMSAKKLYGCVLTSIRKRWRAWARMSLI